MSSLKSQQLLVGHRVLVVALRRVVGLPPGRREDVLVALVPLTQNDLA